MDNAQELQSEKAPTTAENEKHNVGKTELLITEEDQGDPAFVEKAGLINGISVLTIHHVYELTYDPLQTHFKK